MKKSLARGSVLEADPEVSVLLFVAVMLVVGGVPSSRS
jgi:hypothetical protein